MQVPSRQCTFGHCSERPGCQIFVGNPTANTTACEDIQGSIVGWQTFKKRLINLGNGFWGHF